MKYNITNDSLSLPLMTIRSLRKQISDVFCDKVRMKSDTIVFTEI